MRILIAFCFAVAALPAQTVPGPQPESEYHVLANPDRDPWQKPDQVIGVLNFSPSETVAVIENGYPYFAPRIVPYVKQVYAVNTDERAFHGPVPLPPAVSTIVSSWTDPHISSIPVDTVIMVDMLRFLPQRSMYFQGIVAGLKSGGRLVVIDRQLPAVFPAAVNVTSTILKGELPVGGFTLGRQFTFLQPNEFVLVYQH